MANWDSYIIHFQSEQIDFRRLILIQTDLDFQKNLESVIYHNVIGIHIVYILLQGGKHSSILAYIVVSH